MTEVHLSSFNTGNFNKGAGFIKQTLWYFVNALFVRASCKRRSASLATAILCKHEKKNSFKHK